VFSDKLQNEKWLNTVRFRDPRFAIVDSMLLPYMVLPLLFMARGEYDVARDMLSMRSCNTNGKVPTWNEFFHPQIEKVIAQKRNYLKLFQLAMKLLWHRRLMKQNPAGFDKFIDKLIQLVNVTDVTPAKSAYSSYYYEKEEETSFDSPKNFLPKQKAVYDIINAKKPETVLDIGANTGWYSVIASRLGSKVIALEHEESCVDILFDRAKKYKLNILPLKVSFGELKKEIYGIRDANPVYLDRDFDKNPLYRMGKERFRSELVLVLGLAHHLVLGEGYSIERIFEVLSLLTESTLVLEFVDLADEKIVNEPSFFNNINAFDVSSYSLNRFIESGKLHFTNVAIYDSHPLTRKILVFDK